MILSNIHIIAHDKSGDKWQGTLEDLLNDVYCEGVRCLNKNYKLEDSTFADLIITQLTLNDN